MPDGDYIGPGIRWKNIDKVESDDDESDELRPLDWCKECHEILGLGTCYDCIAATNRMMDEF